MVSYRALGHLAALVRRRELDAVDAAVALATRVLDRLRGYGEEMSEAPLSGGRVTPGVGLKPAATNRIAVILRRERNGTRPLRVGALSGRTLERDARGEATRCPPTAPRVPHVVREVLGRIESGAVVAPGEQERLTEEASAVAHLLDLLDSSADEPAAGGSDPLRPGLSR